MIRDGGHRFLSSLVERARPQPAGASAVSVPMLARRRPSLFESRPSPFSPSPTMETEEAFVAAQTGRNARQEPSAPLPAASRSPAAQAIQMPAALPAPGSFATQPAQARPAVDFRSAPPGAEEAIARPQPQVGIRAAQRIDSDAAGGAPGTSRIGSDPDRSQPREPQREMPSSPSPKSAGTAIERTHGIERRTLERTIESTTIREREREREATVAAPATGPRPAPPATSPLPTPSRPVRAETRQQAVAHPSRAAAFAPTPSSQPPAPVTVSIGRIEIRAGERANSAPPPRHTASAPRVGLDDYLRHRHRSGS